MAETYPLHTVRAVCPHDCPDTCGMLVAVRDNVAVSLRGDPDQPFTRGFLCTKVSRYLERTYHPERLKTPLLRVGPKGSGQFRAIGWDEAIRHVAENLKRVANSLGGPQAILPYSYAGTMGKLQGSSLDRRFFHSLGASLLDRTICATAGAAGCEVTLGGRAVVDPDTVPHSRLILNWGSNTAVTNSHLWVRMLQAQKAGAKLVCIDPYKSRTATRSDWWIAPRPGTDGALALGIAHILARDGMVDENYLENHCLGWPEMRQRVLLEYTPDKVAAICGLRVDEVEQLARLYGTTRPALIRLNYGLQRHGGGGMAVRVITCLPALTGDWKHPGGGALLSTSQLFATQADSVFERHDLIPPGTRTINMSSLAEALAGELPGPPVRALVVYNSNPAAVCPDQNRVLQGLRREDLFTVVLEHFLTDTALHADLVLPATTQLEHWDIHTSYGHLMVQLNQPAIPPVGQSKPNTEIFRLLGRAMDLDQSLFAPTDEELIDEVLTERTDTKPFRPAGSLAGITRQRLLAEGAIRLNLPANYSPYATGLFGTPSGKCELVSPSLAARGIDPVPHYAPPHEDPLTRPDLAAHFPLQMICPPEPEFLNSSFVNIEALRQIHRGPRVLLHPHDALSRAITTGQTVKTWNSRGQFTATAEVTEDTRPGVVTAFGIWWSRYTPDGSGVNMTTSSALTDLGAGATFFDNLVQVEKAAPGA